MLKPLQQVIFGGIEADIVDFFLLEVLVTLAVRSL